MPDNDGKSWKDDFPFLQPELPEQESPPQAPAQAPDMLPPDVTLGYSQVLRPEPGAPDSYLTPLVMPPATGENPVGSPLSQPLGISDEEREEHEVRAEEQNEATGTAFAIPEPTSADPGIVRKLDALKPHIDSLSRLARGRNLEPEQIDLLQRYIALKEAETHDLRDQQRQYQAFLRRVAEDSERLKKENRDLAAELAVKKGAVTQLEKAVASSREKHQGEIALLKNEFEDRMRRSGKVDAAASEFYRQRDEWKERIREELKRIKLKEKELENKHELLRRDMQALLDSKDKHVLELKKKTDALELEMETLEDKLRKANFILSNIEAKKRRLLETMRLASGLLASIDQSEGQGDEGSGDPMSGVGSRRTG